MAGIGKEHSWRAGSTSILARIITFLFCFSPHLQVMVLSMDPQRGRVVLSTKKLEPNPGDMLRNPQLVYEKAEEMADMFRKRIGAAEMNARVQSEMAYSGTGEMAAAGDF